MNPIFNYSTNEDSNAARILRWPRSLGTRPISKELSEE